VTRAQPSSNLPASALSEFTKWSTTDWEGGVPLSELLERINRVAEALPGDHDDPDSGPTRVSRLFTERSFRHYQTLQCIDVPEKHGRNASYGYRHFVQALLVRRLLAEGVAATRMPELTGSSSTPELERMFLHGVEVVMRPGGGGEAEVRPSRDQVVRRADDGNSVTGWLRVALGKGVELHLSDQRPKMTLQERQQMLKRIEEQMREIYG
jgi:hypothetical protein